MFLRDLDISPIGSTDSRRLEVVEEGLSLYGGQLAIDATLVSALEGDGTHRRKANTTDGVALLEARQNKSLESNGRAQLVVIQNEVGGRWSSDQKLLVALLARKLCPRPQCSEAVLEQPGTGDGAVFSLVPQRRSLRRW